jgi:phospholipase/lecithinase/hemolysin
MAKTKLIKGAGRQDVIKSRIARWNYRLNEFVTIFRFHHVDAFVEMYDTMEIFHAVFKNPEKFGFKDSTDVCQTGECVWNDAIHPAFSMHKFIAEDLARFLRSMGKGWGELFA